MNVFITGIAGFIGSNLAEALDRQGHTVRGCDNLVDGDQKNINSLLFSNIIWDIADCSDREAMLRLMRLHEIDIVYHCACTAYEGLSFFSPSFVCQNTFQITASVLSAAVEAKVKRFVYFSSMARYGLAKPPFWETWDVDPIDPYGISKVASEKLICAVCGVHEMEWSIAIPHNVYGIKQCYTNPYRNVVAIMINRMLMGKQPIIYGDGSHVRCFSYIDDCIPCLIKLGFEKNANRELLNIGPDDGMISILDLAKLIAEVLNFKLDPIFLPNRPGEVPEAFCSSERARKFYGYETKISLREGIERMANWIDSRGAEKFTYHLPIEINNERTPESWTKKLL